MKQQKKSKNILWFKEIDKDDGGQVGGKGANLGEMFSFKIPVPDGFVVTSHAYYQFIKSNNLKGVIKDHLKHLDKDRPETFAHASEKIKKIIRKSPIPKDISQDIIKNYLQLGSHFKQVLVAVRSSATAEDLPGASFAGQQETYLNVKGEANVVQTVRDCWASLFEARAIFYREEKGFKHMKVGMAVPIQKMVSSDVSGVMFTIDPITNDKKSLIIEAIYGLGEYIVQGKVTPDRYLVRKSDLKILDIYVAKQLIQLVKAETLNKETKVSHKFQVKRKLTNHQIKELATLGKKIHRHYFFPQDIEWALADGKLWILQTRPVTTIKETKKAKETGLEKQLRGKPTLLTGAAASPGIVSGPVKIIKSAKEIYKINKGDILVTSMTTPDFVPAMKKAMAIITDKGGQTSHAAIVSRELGIPCVVGTESATKALDKGQIVTVNGSSGEILKGGIKARPSKEIRGLSEKNKPHSVLSSIKTATKIYVNLGEPERALEVSKMNVEGVGLLRAEFMMAEIGVHPKKAIKDKKSKEYINKLAEGMATFCQHFSPRPVIYRSSDFKTNEYRNLVGGKAFEPVESNPFIGFRGAFRYLSDPKTFELELEAIKVVRNKMGLKNLWMMVPFCRTPLELKEVKKIIGSRGLFRSPSFKLWLMVEIPANVILLEDFIKVGLDGVSIGSNDLTMLTLGIDRDNEELAKGFDEQNPAVLWAIKRTIEVCHRAKVTASICGQAASTYPDLVENLVKWGVTSLSVNPDAIDRTRGLVYQVEKRLVTKRGKN
ncbi:phosphoenolpyruvate synthase [Patescibacteria group bacterium]